MNKLSTFTLTLLSTIMLVYILIVGKALIIPFIVALLIWQFINTIANGIKKAPGIGEYCPNWLCMVLSIIFLLMLAYGIVSIVSDNVAAVINAAPRYQDRFMELLDSISASAHIKPLTFSDKSNWVQQLDLRSFLLNVSSVFTSITGNAVLIFLYVIFLFIEQKVLLNKTQAFFARESSRDLTTHMVHYVLKDTQVYLGIKTLTSLLAAVSSWLIMWKVGLDFSEFWALLIFFLNFIPSIGAITATIFPAVLAAIQFSALPPFLEVTLGISAIQMMIGSFIEPRLMGYSLNLSPLIILMALVIWGTLWGVVGMFLSVPITVTMMIVFSNFEKTRGIAVLLSRDGTLKKRS